MPLELVTAVAVAEPEKVALAPELGAVKVTVAPPTGLAPLITVTWREVEKALLTVVACGVPAVAPMVVVLEELPDALKARMIVGACGLPLPFQVAACEPVVLTD
jgi:hypothetical protein